MMCVSVQMDNAEINRKIARNMVRCCLCLEVIESTHVHDFKKCSCGACGVDGGTEYLKRLGKAENMQELTEYK